MLKMCFSLKSDKADFHFTVPTKKKSQLVNIDFWIIKSKRDIVYGHKLVTVLLLLSYF